MPKIQWDPSFSVQIPEIDEQHKEWIAIINGLHDLLMHGVVSSETVHAQLTRMLEYVRYHFTFEEQYMQSIDYPLLAEHKEEHRTFLLELERITATERQGEIVLPTEVMQMLIHWLKNHILCSDKKYMMQPE